MNKLTPLQQLTETIYTQLPELKELGVGCEIQNKANLKKYKIGVFISESFCVLDNNAGYPLTVNNKITDFYTIIGKPITLTDVLRWMKFIYKDNDYTFIIKRSVTLDLWNLQQNLLENQPQAVIDFLNNL